MFRSRAKANESKDILRTAALKALKAIKKNINQIEKAEKIKPRVATLKVDDVIKQLKNKKVIDWRQALVNGKDELALMKGNAASAAVSQLNTLVAEYPAELTRDGVPSPTLSVISPELNSKNQTVFIVDKDGDTSITSSAKHLGSAFYRTEAENVTVLNLADSHALDYTKLNEPLNIVVLGHANSESYGGYDAAEFVDEFTARCLESNPDFNTNQTIDLYLVGCGMGLVNSNGQSLAQDIANRFARNYPLFPNIVVHAVATPTEEDKTVMIVEVLHQNNRYEDLTRRYRDLAKKQNGEILYQSRLIEPGFLAAYLYSEEDYDEMKRLSAQSRRSSADNARIEEISQQARLHAAWEAPKDLLNLPQNKFYPGESLQVRETRIEADTNLQLSAQHAEAMSLLKQRCEYLRQRDGRFSKLASELDKIIMRLQNAGEKNWNEAFRDIISDVQESPLRNVAFFKRTVFAAVSSSTTINLLNALNINDFDTARELIDKQASRRSNERIEVNERSSAAQSEPAGVTPVVLTIDQQKFAELKNVIRELKSILENETSFLVTKWHTPFNLFERNTKQKKQDCLEALLRTEDIGSLLSRARIESNKSRVKRHVKTSRVYDLLNELTANTFDITTCDIQELKSRVIIAQSGREAAYANHQIF